MLVVNSLTSSMFAIIFDSKQRCSVPSTTKACYLHVWVALTMIMLLFHAVCCSRVAVPNSKEKSIACALAQIQIHHICLIQERWCRLSAIDVTVKSFTALSSLDSSRQLLLSSRLMGSCRGTHTSKTDQKALFRLAPSQVISLRCCLGTPCLRQHWASVKRADLQAASLAERNILATNAGKGMSMYAWDLVGKLCWEPLTISFHKCSEKVSSLSLQRVS